MPRLKSISQGVLANCGVKKGGITNVFLLVPAALTASTWVNTVTADAETVIMTTATITVGEMIRLTFNNDNTAFHKQSQSDVGAQVDQSLFIAQDGIDDLKVDLLNALQSTCEIYAFIVYNDGSIFFVGREYDLTLGIPADVQIPKPLRLKGATDSGVGGGDSSKIIYEWAGISNFFARRTSLTLDNLIAKL